MNKITKPEQRTYWIAYSNTITHYGICDVTQEMVTGQPTLWTTTDEAEWVAKLETEFNTNPFPDEDLD